MERRSATECDGAIPPPRLGVKARSLRQTPDRRTNARSHALAHARRPSAPRSLSARTLIFSPGRVAPAGQRIDRGSRANALARGGATPTESDRASRMPSPRRFARMPRPSREISSISTHSFANDRRSRKSARRNAPRRKLRGKRASPSVKTGSSTSTWKTVPWHRRRSRGARRTSAFSLRGQSPHGRGRSRECRLTEVAPLWFRNGPSRRGNRPGSKTSSPQRCDGHSLTSRPLRPTRISSQTRQKGTGHQVSRRRARTSRCLFRHFSRS